jgi:hypothetical protein
MIIIGSTAIKYFYPDFPREPKDFDVILESKDENIKPYLGENFNKKIEILENPIILEYYKGNGFLPPNLLCTLKASHLCWNINWEKHMFDLQFLLKKGNKIDFELFKQLYDYWNTVHSKNKRSDLKMSKQDFFDNSVNYNENEHDFIHTILNPIPIYTKCLKDGCEVELDENKFHALSHEDKLEFVREEIYVMSFERYKELGYKHAYNKMLKKFIISHAPFFSIIFILENYIELEKCQKNYFKIIENGLQENKQLVK